MAPAPDNLSPAGSSTYSSSTLYVGDGTWDATKNDFLLPNLVGFNFDTMQYNGMGNRFSTMPGYKNIIKGHAIVAAITFLFIVPTAIMTARFYGRNPGEALRFYTYLQIFTLLLSTVVLILGWQAVGPSRSLTNPHHGIGLAIYVLIWVQFLGGWWVHSREKGKTRYRIPLKLYIHQWLERAVALLAIAQVPLGLTLYGSPKYLFILYALWMTFLLVLYFILSYRATAPIGGAVRTHSAHGGTVIEEKRRGRWGSLLGGLAAGAGGAWLLSRRNKSRDRSRVRTEEVIPSRRGSRRGSRRDSGSFIEEKYEERPHEDNGLFGTLLKGAALVGAAGLAKSWYDRRQRRKVGDDYTSVANDTPSRRHRRRADSISEDSLSVHRMEQGRLPSGSRRSTLLPGPGDPVAAAAAISAAEAHPSRPMTPRPTHGRAHSFDSGSYSYDSTISPSRRPQTPPSHRLRNSLAAGVGLAWLAKKFKDRRDRKEQERVEEEERIQRAEGRKYTGDGFPSPSRRHGRRGSRTESTDLSSVINDPHHIRPDGIPSIPAALAGAAAGAALAQSRSRHDITDQVSMPPAPADPQGVLHQESGSEQYFSSGGGPHRQHSIRRQQEGDAAAAAAVAGAASLAAEEETRRRRSRSRNSQAGEMVSPPVSVKVKMHGDRDRNVTLRRLTEQEAAAEREARRGHRRRRADRASSLSGTDTATSRQRYRRDDRERREADEIAAEKRAEAGAPPMMAPLSPPNPAFAGGRRPKDSAYYSGRPGSAGGAGPSGGYPAGSGVGGGSVGSPESHGTWSAMSPGSGRGSGEDAAERRRRRRLERNQRGGTAGTVDYS